MKWKYKIFMCLIIGFIFAILSQIYIYNSITSNYSITEWLTTYNILVTQLNNSTAKEQYILQITQSSTTNTINTDILNITSLYSNNDSMLLYSGLGTQSEKFSLIDNHSHNNFITAINAKLYSEVLSISSLQNNLSAHINLTLLKSKIICSNSSEMYHNRDFTNPQALYSNLTIKDLFLPPNLSNEQLGKVNTYIWQEQCLQDVSIIRNIGGFPYNPYVRRYASSLYITYSMNKYAQRVFGFIIPSYSGLHRFAIAADDTAELWLSYNHNPLNCELIAYVNRDKIGIPPKFKHSSFSKSDPQISEIYNLHKNKTYYFEILHVNLDNINFVEVSWLFPNSQEFEIISKENLAAYILDEGAMSRPETVHPTVMFPMHNKNTNNYYSRKNPRAGFHLFELIPNSMIDEFFSYYNQSISWARPHYVAHHTGFTEVREIAVYPDDQTEGMDLFDKNYGNSLIAEDEALEVVKLFMNTLNSNYSKFYLQDIVNIEKTVNPTNGNRYLVELTLQSFHEYNKVYRVSNYFYRSLKEPTKLYQPRQMHWNPNTFVHIVVTSKNLCHWVREFVENMEKIYADTQDENFGVIIVDFQSSDNFDTKTLLRQSTLKHWNFIRMTGKFIKVQAQNAALLSVTNPDDIVFLCDLHLIMPSNTIEIIRRHTFQGKSAYAPALLRLHCGHTPQNPVGFWEFVGYGLFSLYKSDWIAIGGMNMLTYKDSWGGEDWDLTDRVLSLGYEVYRLRQQGLFHYYHSRGGLWEKYIK